MFNHQQYLDVFLSDYLVGKFTNDSVAKVHRFESYPCFRIIGVHHLTGEENRSKRNLFMCVVNSNGRRLNEKISWGWEGQRPDEKPNPVVLDKPTNEPGGNISIDWGQKIWAEVLGKQSDKIYNVTTQLPDDGPWNTLGHHSYFCVWMLTGGDSTPPPIEPPGKEYERGFTDGSQAVKNRIQEVLNKL